MNIGNARVSTLDQNLELQLDALTKAGCEVISQERVSGVSKVLPELNKFLVSLRKGVGLISLTDAINTISTQGWLVFNLFAPLAEFEQELICERTYTGLSPARARGHIGGRQRGLSEAAERNGHRGRDAVQRAAVRSK